MSKRIRLDGYLPVRFSGRFGLCPELTLDEVLVDFPDGDCPAEGRLELLCRDDLTVVASATRQGEVTPGRFALRIDSFEGEGRDGLVGHVSSLRKSAHLNIVAHHDVEAATVRAGWDRWRFDHAALPELDVDALDTTTTLLGRPLAAPLIVAGMTGGSERAGEINLRVARAAAELGLGMGLGSQRAMLERRELASTFDVRRVAPDILLLGNVGAVQLNYGVSIDDIKWLVDAVEADALAVHLNVLQELVQPEGDRAWSGLRRKVEALVAALDVPVVLKETGAGMTGELASFARNIGCVGVDVGGTGGTSWGWIEGFRAADPHRQAIGATFRDWGVPTADALVACREAAPGLDIVATGGVRSGLDVATAVALGATAAGMALPFFRAADESVEEAVALGRRVVEELRIAMVCSGAGRLSDLTVTRKELR